MKSLAPTSCACAAALVLGLASWGQTPPGGHDLFTDLKVGDRVFVESGQRGTMITKYLNGSGSGSLPVVSAVGPGSILIATQPPNRQTPVETKRIPVEAVESIRLFYGFE